MKTPGAIASSSNNLRKKRKNLTVRVNRRLLSGCCGPVSSEDITSPPLEKLLSMSGELRRTLYASSGTSLDLEPFIPELRGVTEILTEEHRKQLSRHLPARAEGYTWTLVFSTSQHGFSLNSLYRKMANVHSPILMVIEDTQNN
ncbi:LysM, partial [Nesidiocoris tenuis]